MSGLGSGGYGGRSGGGHRDCNIVESVPLNSVKRATLKTLSVGQLLEVSVSEGRVLTARTQKGDVAGSLTPQSLPELLDCIEKGHRYQAHVNQIKGAFVEVEIRPR